MIEIFFIILQTLAQLLVEPSTPPPDPSWTVVGGWEAQPSGALRLVARSATVVDACRADPDAFIYTPNLVQGAHELWLDGHLLLASGDSSFQRAPNMYNIARLSCRSVAKGQLLEWRAFNLTHSYARFNSWPTVSPRQPMLEYFLTYLPAVASTSLLMGAGICLILFSGRVATSVVATFAGATLLFALHFALTTPELFGLSVRPLNLHRSHDGVLWLGTVFLFASFRMLRLVPRAAQIFQASLVGLSIATIAVSRNLDQAQVGSTLSFIGNVTILVVLVAMQVWRIARTGITRRAVLGGFLLASFAVAGVNDIGYHAGAWQTLPVYPLGVIASVLFLALVVNEDILAAYRERDDLRESLERKVEEKTRSLEENAASLKQAYQELQVAQAEMIQNAKLASLGTLAAGIAHEINNSLNFVNGALPLLERIVAKPALTDLDTAQARKLVTAMQDGLTRSFEIIRNLKRHSRKAATDLEAVPVKEVVEGVIVLIKARMSEHRIAVDVAVPADATVRATQVGLSQVLMNLVSNAIDALAGREEPRRIQIGWRDDGRVRTIEVKDNGAGMPLAVKDRLFEPFFTTKGEGKGTGLGLHLVKKEIDSFGAQIAVDTVVGTGTTFLLHFKTDATNVPIRERGAA